MNYRKLLIGLLFVTSITALVGFVVADTYPIQKIALQLNKWVLKNPVEKVYLQLDKPYYAAGDDIWFKAYVTIGSQHELTALSGVLNVELIDDRDSVKRHIKLPLVNGLTWGDFALSDTLAEGNYRIRAYTNWMRNAGEDYFFDEPIRIIDAFDKIDAHTTYSYSIQNGRQQVNALISYSNGAGNALANTEVKYTVDFDTKTIIRGKATTDDKGNINISFLAPVGALPLNSGRINTVIKTGKTDFVTKVIPVRAASANIDVQFFPESGTLVNDINSKVAFKAVGADGLGKDIKGTITDSKGNTITSFSSQHLGMGVFNLLPQAGENYTAHITYADGSSNTVALPKPVDKGYVLTINNSDTGKLRIKIISNQQIRDEDPQDTLSLIAQADGEVCYAAKSNPGSASFTASISKKRLPTGVIQFTLFSSKGEPLNERLVFIQNDDQLKLDVKAEKKYGLRQRVNITFDAKNSDAKPVVGSFSVAVTDESKVPQDENSASTILTNLLLTSDIKGYVEQPNYYFIHADEQVRNDLDVLMLTQGYHRFDWRRVLNDNIPEAAYQPEKAFRISGHITTSGGKPIVNGKVTLLTTAGKTFFTDTVTDAKGKFSFNNLSFPDSVKFVIQARTDKNHKNVQIDLDDISPQGSSHNKNAPDFQVNVYDGLSTYVQASKDLVNQQMKYGLAKRTIVLKEVVVKDTRILLKHSANLNGPGNADQVLVGDQIPTGCATIDQCLQGRLFFINFINGVPYSTRGGSLSINVDGVFISPDEFNTLNINDIESIEVLRTGSSYAIYGSQAGKGGIIVITTKRGDDITRDSYKRPAPGIITYSPVGYYKIRTFYSPQYDDPKTNQSIADQRSTIYWNPNIVTDKDGKASFQFFNAGNKGTYRVIIEGIDIDGNIGRQVYRYKVE
ncbi:carboxypeptidase-like regulatory domain-containing protein [Mucilaginibacter sp.]